MMKRIKATSKWLKPVVAVLIVALAILAGCGRTRNDVEEIEDVTPYVGTWACIGIQDDDGLQALEEYSAATGEAYSATMVVRENGFAYLLEEEDGEISSEVEPWLERDYRVVGDEESHRIVPEGPYYLSDYFKLANGLLIMSAQDGTELVFARTSESVEPLYRRLRFPECSVVVPIELAEQYDMNAEYYQDFDQRTFDGVVGLDSENFEGRRCTSAHLYVSRTHILIGEHPEGEAVTVDGNTL